MRQPSLGEDARTGDALKLQGQPLLGALAQFRHLHVIQLPQIVSIKPRVRQRVWFDRPLAPIVALPFLIERDAEFFVENVAQADTRPA